MSRKVFTAATLGLVALAFLLRHRHLGTQEVWNDEAFSYFLATGSRWLAFARVDSTPPLYYLLLRGWAAVASGGEVWLRLPSALLGAAFVGATAWTGATILDRPAALWAAGFATIAPIHIYYSQEARHYALLVLLLQVLLGLVWRALDTNAWSRWAAVAVCAALVLYTHYLGSLVLAALLLLPWIRGDRDRWPRQIAAFLAAALAVAPWVLLNLRAKSAVIGAGSPIAWVGEVWSRTPPLLAIPKSLEILGLGSHRGLVPLALKQMSLIDLPALQRWTGVAALAALFVMVVLRAGRREAALFVLVFFPLTALWCVSFVQPLYVAGRFDLLALPAYVLIVGLALAKLGRIPAWGRSVALIALLALLVPVTTELHRYYRHEPVTRRRATAAMIRESAQSGDLVVFTGLRGLATLYYLERLGTRWDDGWCVDAQKSRYACRLFPRSTERVLAASTAGGTPSPQDVRIDVADYLDRLDATGSRLWVVLDAPSEADRLLFEELRRRGFIEREAETSLRIVRLER